MRSETQKVLLAAAFAAAIGTALGLVAAALYRAYESLRIGELNKWTLFEVFGLILAALAAWWIAAAIRTRSVLNDTPSGAPSRVVRTVVVTPPRT